MWAVAAQPRTGLTPMIPTPSVDSGMAWADVTSNLLLRAGTRGAGGEALHGGGDARQVELAEVVHHVPPHARQVSGPGAAQPAQASVGENGVQPAAVAGGSLPGHQALGLQAAHDPRHAAERERARGGQVAHPQAPPGRLGQVHQRGVLAQRHALAGQQIRVQGARDPQGRPRPRAQERLLRGAQRHRRGSPASSRHGPHSTCLTKHLLASSSCLTQQPLPRERAVTRIGIILGSTRPNRNGEQVARWVLEIASRRHDAHFELLDLRDYPLPHLDEPLPPSFGDYQNEHTQQWAAKIASFDGFVIVTPEYNHGTSGVLKNAIDYLYAEWNNKAVGFVSYGGAGGARAVEHLRLVAGELQMADVRQQVALSLMTEFENFSVFKPGDYNLPALNTMLDQVVAWSTALAPLRDTAGVAA